MKSTPRQRMVAAALDLLRAGGLSGAGINSVIVASGAPKGSLYHYFPRGKSELVTTALRSAEEDLVAGWRTAFAGDAAVGAKVRTFFTAKAANMQAQRFTRGCPVAAVTVDLDRDAGEIARVCAGIFDACRDAIAGGLHEVPEAERRAVADTILAALEGAMVLARAHASPRPLRDVGDALATALGARSARAAGVRRARTKRRA
jgi:TetR/AcrR family transcriptional repressor of lmrAB and yxaGH operons